MTNNDYICENMTNRDIAYTMNPFRVGFARNDIFSRAWYAFITHCKAMEGYKGNVGNIYISGDNPVNPFRYSVYHDYSQGEAKHGLIAGHPEIAAYDTWLCKQYNPDEWK